ncbi:MAG: class I SAM-dependent methyltransferase [Ancalomicrobiaceae bacterium]|nr:class I SAM-dependent methyltransferase [Ancalomicrobiaceae bacterium]
MPGTTMGATPLEYRLKALIRLGGPLSIADYMAICLGDPEHGYYMARDPFGANGDFVTAPEVSQMFGELVGLWAADIWVQAGRPSPFSLVEIGPGRGTLMLDALRACRIVPGFMAAARVLMVETSPRLAAIQQDRLSRAGHNATWATSTTGIPDGPAIILANEFFDALPVRQFVRVQGIWRERVVGLDADDNLAFGIGPAVLPTTDVPAHLRSADNGSILELAPTAAAIAEQLALRIARSGLALLAIDYGYTETAVGDSFQAVRAHSPVDPLARPGEADLTALVNFEVLHRAATKAGAGVSGPIEQGDFLLNLGLAERAGRLGADKDRATREGIEADVHRLVAAEEMGSLFKAIAFSKPGLLPAGFGR